MNKAASLFKPLMPILSAVYGFVVIYVTALPVSGDNPTFWDEFLTWLITLAAIALTLFLVHRVEPKVFPTAKQFPLKLPKIAVIVGLLLIAPLWLVAEEYIVYGVTSLVSTIQLKPLTYTTAELKEDLLSSVHAVLLAPILEELCFRQMAISPFRRRGAQIVVCVVMAVLFGMLHVRNFPGAFISAMFYGLVFVWSRNIWYSVTLHAGSNLAATLLAVYCWLQLGDMQMTSIPVIILPDMKVIIANLVLAIVGGLILKTQLIKSNINKNDTP
jgi:membrane protease YdiL (CAAX protease family)